MIHILCDFSKNKLPLIRKSRVTTQNWLAELIREMLVHILQDTHVFVLTNLEPKFRIRDKK